MNDLYPLVSSKKRPPHPKEIPAHTPSRLSRPEEYIADPGLVDAVNVALLLRQPLMVSGEPGVGKSVLAWSVAWELGLDPPLVFETKSTSQARDLFYFYDTLGRFTAKELRADAASAKDYITYSALGRAIVLTNALEKVSDILPVDFYHPGTQRSVVLLDEIEKAPRDFANDILNELERMYFRIPELGNRRVDAEEALHPIIVMTNNSEKSLPDAFLRRCIYYNIPFPTGPRLEDIIIARLPEFVGSDAGAALRKDVVDFLIYIRQDNVSLEKPPGTAELLNWLTAMARLGAKPELDLAAQIDVAARAFPALVKISDDQTRARELLVSWKNEHSNR